MILPPAQQKQLEIYLQKIRLFRKSSYALFLVAGVIVLSTFFFHSYPHLYTRIREHKAEINQTENKLLEQEQLLEKKNRELEQKTLEYAVVLEEWKPILDKVLPMGNPTDDVTKFLEDFSLTYNSKKHPMTLESIAFGNPRQEDEYMTLPFRMTIEADEYNFTLFMKQIQVSGSLDSEDFYKSRPVPLLSIEAINLELPEEKDIDPALGRIGGTSGNTVQTPEIPIYVFNVEMHAYFLKEPETEEQK